MMAYNPYSAINSIYNLKGQWDEANKAGDDARKNAVAQKAQTYYNQLRQNGYSGVADELTASGLEASKKINDKWAKQGKSRTRDYLYSLGAKDGLSRKEMDNLIGWDNDTGEVSFGGRVIGTPDSVLDGVSYWSDTSKLDNAYNDYKTRSGLSRSKPIAVNQENESLFKKYNQEYEDLKKTNPFETEVAKSILAKYDLAGLQGRDNQAAVGGAQNSGNIDSFSAANALRQQAALVSKGQEAVLNAYQQKLDHAKNLLSDMGVNIERVYNEDETSKNNQVSRDVATSEVTGVVPESMSYASNPFFNKDGTLKNDEIDYQAVIDNAQAKLQTTTDSAEKSNLESTIRYAKQARVYKIQNNPLYSKYANTISLYSPDETANYKLQNKQIDSAERISKAGNDANLAAVQAELASNEKIANAANQNALDQIDKTTAGEKEIMAEQAKYQTKEPALSASQAATAIKNGEISQTVIDAYNYHYGTSYTVDNPPKIQTSGGSTSGTSSADEWNEFYDDFDKEKVQNFLTDYIRPLYQNNTEVTDEMLKNLILDNTENYDIDVDDARKILSQFGADTTWLSGYKDRWGFNSGKGMKEN